MHAGTSMISDRKQGADPTQGHVQLCAASSTLSINIINSADQIKYASSVGITEFPMSASLSPATPAGPVLVHPDPRGRLFSRLGDPAAAAGIRLFPRGGAGGGPARLQGRPAAHGPELRGQLDHRCGPCHRHRAPEIPRGAAARCDLAGLCCAAGGVARPAQRRAAAAERGGGRPSRRAGRRWHFPGACSCRSAR